MLQLVVGNSFTFAYLEKKKKQYIKTKNKNKLFKKI